jgi:hypothetical protein
LEIQNKDERLIMAVIISISLVIALLIITGIPNEPISDFSFYHQAAVKYSSGQDYYSLTKPMGYPILLGSWYKSTDTQSVLSGKFLNLLLFSLSLITLYIFARKLDVPSPNKYIFLCLVAFNPILLFFNNVLGVETASFLVLTWISYTYLMVSGRQLIQVVLLGILIALLVTLKPYFIILPAVLFLIDIATGRKITGSFSRLAITYTVLLLVVSPFAVENFQRTGNLQLVPSNSEIVLYINNNDDNIHGGYLSFSAITPPAELLLDFELIGKEYEDRCPECVKIYGKYARQWIINNLDQFIILGILRWGRIFYYPGTITWAVNQNTCLEPPCGDTYYRRFINFLIRGSDMMIFIFSSCLVFLTAFYSLDIFRTLLRKTFINRFMGYSFFGILFQLGIYFFGEGQPRYIHTFILFGSLLFLYTMSKRVRVSLIEDQALA